MEDQREDEAILSKPDLESSNGSPKKLDWEAQTGSQMESANTAAGEKQKFPPEQESSAKQKSPPESDIPTELNRRTFLRSWRTDISSTMNAYAVVLVLLASVTFTSNSQPPGGFDDDGFLKFLNATTDGRKCSPSCISGVIISASASFHLAVTAILICMSCLAFVIPSESKYPDDLPVGELGFSLGETRLSERLTGRLGELKRINDQVSGALQMAQVLSYPINLLFVVSVWSAVYVAERSLDIVLPGDASFKASVHNPIIGLTATFYVICCLYSSVLLWKILTSALKSLLPWSKVNDIPDNIRCIWSKVKPTLESWKEQAKPSLIIAHICIAILILTYFILVLLFSLYVLRVTYPAIKKAK